MEVVVNQALPVDFSTFLVSLASAAMVNLGETPDPSSGESGASLALARNSIDLIAMLGEKTKGNLDDDEVKLLESLLYDLRMRFVDAQKKA